MAIEPVTREELFLAAAGGQNVTPPTPITRKEQLLQGIIDAVQSGGATPDVIENAVNKYLDANPVKPGATTEQAAQIEQNKTDIADLQTEVDELKESGGGSVDLTGVVRSVNGRTPDEKGNVEIDVSGSGENLDLTVVGGRLYITVDGERVGNGVAFGSADTPAYYSVTNALTNCVSDNDAASVEAGTAYSAVLTPAEGYTMEGATVTITMGDEDITETAYAAGIVSIPAVTGDVVITAAAVATIVSISAIYSGGDVAVGTALTELTGIVVTATYADGATATITDYTLSGEIAEGENVITITYGALTATITVVGTVTPLYGTYWPPIINAGTWTNAYWETVCPMSYVNETEGLLDAGFPSGAFTVLQKPLTGTVFIRSLTENPDGFMGPGYRVFANADGMLETGGFVEVPRQKHTNLGTVTVGETEYQFVLFEFTIPDGHTGYFTGTTSAAEARYFIMTADKKAILDEYRPYYTLFDYNPLDRVTEPAVEGTSNFTTPQSS